jgi:hypothetical protein
MNANEKQTLHLPAGQVLSIAAASGARGCSKYNGYHYRGDIYFRPLCRDRTL